MNSDGMEIGRHVHALDGRPIPNDGPSVQEPFSVGLVLLDATRFSEKMERLKATVNRRLLKPHTFFVTDKVELLFPIMY
jgi:hypothetical protein